MNKTHTLALVKNVIIKIYYNIIKTLQYYNKKTKNFILNMHILKKKIYILIILF